MAFKLICFFAFVAVARAGLPYAAPLAYAAAPAHVAYSAPAHVAYAAPVAKVAVAEPYNTNPQYSFSYDVQDGLTGDSKSAHESRNGDVVEGSYSLTDPDGTRRTVDYTADAHNGFNAVVRKEPLVQKTIVAAAPVAKVAYAAAPVHYAAPAQLAYSAPAHVAYSAPAHVAYSAPAQLAYSAPAYTKIAAPLAYAGHGYAAHGYAAPAAHYLH